MAIPDSKKVYPRTGDNQTVYLKNVITNPNIEIGDFTFYNDFVNDPKDFERNNVLYHYPINHDKLKIGKFCSIACGAKFLFNSANHSMRSLSSYPFPIFYDTVYIVSNLSLKEQYTNIQQSEPKTWAAFCRRITAVYDFDKSKDIPVNKFTGELKKPPTLIEIADDGDIPF